MPVTGWGTDREILLIFAAAYVCLQEIYYCFFSILYLDKERDIIYNPVFDSLPKIKSL